MVRARSQRARGSAAARRLRLRAGRFLAALGMPRAELSLLLVGDREMRRLNRTWRGVDRPTDVLSFPAAPAPGGARAPAVLGDVVISLDTAERRAREEGRAVAAELDRYLAHGLLHLLGFDHGRAGEARAMAAREAELLGAEGMVGSARAGPRSRSRPRPSPGSRP